MTFLVLKVLKRYYEMKNEEMKFDEVNCLLPFFLNSETG